MTRRAKTTTTAPKAAVEILEPEDLEEGGGADELGDEHGVTELLGEGAGELPLPDEEPPSGDDDAEAPLPSASTSLVRFDPLQQYLSEIRRYPLLKPDQEYELATHYHETKDLKTAQKLVTSNLRLVVKIAHDYQKYWMNLLDLVQEGNVGLMQAVRHYDPYRGVKLSSYSSFWIKAYILKFIIDNWSLVKIGTTQAQRKLFFNLRREKEKYALLGYDPDTAQIASDMGVKPELVTEMEQRLQGGDFSLDAPLGNDSEGSHIDFLADHKEGIDDQLADLEIRDLFREKLSVFRSRLKEKELYIFDHRLLAEQPSTLNEIGERFNISRERIRQIEERMIAKLRQFFKEEVPELADFTIAPAPDPEG